MVGNVVGNAEGTEEDSSPEWLHPPQPGVLQITLFFFFLKLTAFLLLFYLYLLAFPHFAESIFEPCLLCYPNLPLVPISIERPNTTMAKANQVGSQ